VIFSAQINGLNTVKGPRSDPPRPKCESVPNYVKNDDWRIDIGKRLTITIGSRISSSFHRRKKKGSLHEWVRRQVDQTSRVTNWFVEAWTRVISITKGEQISRFIELKKLRYQSKITNHVSGSWLMSLSGGVRGVLGRLEGNKHKHHDKFTVVIFAFFISTNLMLSLTIFLLLLQQSVERNPGPKQARIPIVTYNTNGLGSKDKLKRIMNKLDPMVGRGGIAMLQETHVKDLGYLKMIWKHKYSSNCDSSNSAGLLTMYGDQYTLIDEFSDGKGRLLIVAIKTEDEKFIVINSYYPNDHRIGLEFSNDLYEKIIQFQQRYPDFDTIYAGDLNICVSKVSDSLNRNRTKSEDLLSELIVENNKVVEVTDAYRAIKKKDGYTWRRGECYSRLDYVFMSKSIKHRIASAATDWAFDSSDHAAVLVELFTSESPRGPGLTKVNNGILKDPEISKKIGLEIEEMMSQSDPDWNPHTKLEFLKVCIRSVFASKVSEGRVKMTKTISEKEDEINQLENLKIEALKNSNTNNRPDQSEKIDSALSTLKNIVNQLRSKLSESMNFASRAKWFEYGEKSNKFFLNLNKRRQKQKLIERIKNGENSYEGHKNVSAGIRRFYQDLYKARSDYKDEDESYYDNCPKLSEKNKALMEKNLDLQDLRKALNSCKDSAPGPDGIPYEVYRKFWNITGRILLDAWNYSVEKGVLPPSHEESVITLLPKDGKDAGDIKNWRPITLSNCDSKIITKALANKMSVVLDSIIDYSQTAYIPGRAVADNLRSNMYMKNKCKEKNIDSVLISLDAKKAFDSVDHIYIRNTLKAYGFGKNFIDTFNILYRNITARILVNGFTTDSIKIERGVKQGDALSCAIFIICIDPVLRNMNNNKEIIEIKSAIHSKVFIKAAAYADDISVICKNDAMSIQHVFNEYGRLTNLSGLELNADKTEILVMNSETVAEIEFQYNGSLYKIQTVEKMKICGLFYCTKQADEHNINVKEKIKKLSDKIRAWSHRHLTMEGKILIVKTFGLSQLIYNMQIYDYKKEDLINIERIIFKFIWSNSEAQNGVDRIKRSIMKNSYENGGLNVTDVESLNRALKLKQFIRASSSKHVISLIQEDLTKSPNLINEYDKVTTEESICGSAQDTMNVISDYNRSLFCNLKEEEYVESRLLINEVASINLKRYLKNKKKVLCLCILKPLTNMNIITLGDLVQSYEHEMNKKTVQAMKIVIGNFPKPLIKIANCFNENINSDSEKMDFMMTSPQQWSKLPDVTVKQMQVILKNALKKTSALNVVDKLKIESFREENIVEFRHMCKNPKLRNIYFRLIHNDFFTHVKMKKYNMTQTDQCPRCGDPEDLKHLLWECSHAKHIWSMYNDIMSKVNNTRTNCYQEIFVPGDNHANCIIKIKLIQALIQIERPKNWTYEMVKKIIVQTMTLELYNATKSDLLLSKHNAR